MSKLEEQQPPTKGNPVTMIQPRRLLPVLPAAPAVDPTYLRAGAPVRGLVAANFHINRACDSKCTFCFAEFRDPPRQLDEPGGLAVIEMLRRAGVEKLNFAGGEPTLHRSLARYVTHAKSLGMTTSIVTNGFKLDELLDVCADALDWVGLSVDSGDESLQSELGRGHGDHVRRSIAHAERCRSLGVRVKLNMVVTALNVHDDLSGLVRSVRPERWKVFQALLVEGQNDGRVEPLLITSEAFAGFLGRHGHLAAEGFPPVAETNEAMTDSYVMVDPAGRCFGNTNGQQIYSAPLLEVGVEVALAAVGYRSAKLEARGGLYQW